jgi:hypothetical protein
MNEEVYGKRKKIYQMFDLFKIEAERLLSSIQAVDKFIFIDTHRDHIFDFVRICNYLLTEYDFIMHGKSHTQFRKSNRNGFDFDAITKKRVTVKKENDKLLVVDCQLGDYGNKIFGEYKTLTTKISLFQDFLSKHNLSSLVPYELGLHTDVFQWLGKLPLTGYSVSFEGYDIYQSISSHPWKAKTKKRSSMPQPQPSAKKVKIAEVGTEGKQSSTKPSSKSLIVGNMAMQLPNKSKLLSAKKVKIAETLTDQEGKQSSSNHEIIGHTPIAKSLKVNVVTPFPLDNVEECLSPQVDEGVHLLSIQKYKFSNKSHENNEQELQSLALDLFTQEQNLQTSDREIFLKILAHFVNLQCSFQDFFLLLERLVLQVKKREEIHLSNSDFFKRQSRSKQLTMKDDLQRSARKCMSSIGLKIFSFLKAFKEVGNTAAQVDLITSFWPMATLSDSDLHAFQQSLAVIVSLVYAEDTLLVQLSTDGFQKVRKYLFFAIVQPSVKKFFQLNELDKCIAEIERFLSEKSGYELRFSKEVVICLLTDYFNSIFPSKPNRVSPKETRTAKKKKELESSAISSEPIADAEVESVSLSIKDGNFEKKKGISTQTSKETVSKASEESSVQSYFSCIDSQHAEESSILSQVSRNGKDVSRNGKDFHKLSKRNVNENVNELDSDDEFMYGITIYDKLPEADYIPVPISDHDSIDGSNVIQAEIPVIIHNTGSGNDARAQSESDIKKAIADLKALVSLEDVFENLDLFWEEEIL